MKMKRFIAVSMQEAMQQVGDALGPDALILSNRKTGDGVEVIAAVDYEADLLDAGIEEVVAAAPPPVETVTPPVEQEPAPVADAAVLEDMQAEIRALRNMLEVPLAQLGWDEVRRREPVRAAVVERLEAMQVHRVVANTIADRITEKHDDRQGWGEALGEFAGMLPVEDDRLMQDGGIVALVGPTGVGKTTTIAKLAARFAMQHGRRHIALVTMDHYRIGAHEQLRTYGKLLGVPVHIAEDADELNAVINQMHDRRLILIDTAGTSQHDPDLLDKFSILDTGGRPLQRYLVLSAAGQTAVTDDIVNAFSVLRPDRCVLTKLDEATGIGGVLSVLVKHGLPVTWTGNGQQVPDDLQAAQAEQLVLLAEDMAGRTTDIHTDESWLHAVHAGEVHAHANLVI